MTVRSLALRLAPLTAALVVAACGSSPSATASLAMPTGAPGTELVVPSFLDRSFVLPSFVFPSFTSDEELEALLPDAIGGQAVIKVSMTGDDIRNMPGGFAIEDQLGELGATVDDVSVAIGTTGNGTSGGVVVLAYRIAGVSAEQIFQGLEDALQEGQGGEVTQITVGGRRVTRVVSGTETTYIYLAGDVVFVVGGAVTGELLEDAISQLPAD
jgi:hypothetical protein